MQMPRVLVTGMSGTGKSTLLRALAEHGYATVDTDEDGWCEWSAREAGWVWREERMRQLLARDRSELLVVSGCVSNQGRFYPQFDEIILLTAPTEVIVQRLAERTTNTYGKQPHELAEVLGYIDTVEPLLRRGATLEIDTSAPLAAVVAAVLARVNANDRPRGEA